MSTISRDVAADLSAWDSAVAAQGQTLQAIPRGSTLHAQNRLFHADWPIVTLLYHNDVAIASNTLNDDWQGSQRVSQAFLMQQLYKREFAGWLPNQLGVVPTVERLKALAVMLEAAGLAKTAITQPHHPSTPPYRPSQMGSETNTDRYFLIFMQPLVSARVDKKLQHGQELLQQRVKDLQEEQERYGDEAPRGKEATFELKLIEQAVKSWRHKNPEGGSEPPNPFKGRLFFPFL